MLKKPMWNQVRVSECGRFHLLEDRPLYAVRYTQVLKYHEPGLAPAHDDSGAFHIDVHGNPAYHKRFVQTFGFYQGLAAVQDADGFFHIDPSGQAAYSQRYRWCGNFQEGFCVVQEQNTSYHHINLQGERCYTQCYPYAGDFKEGYSVACDSASGLHTHINPQGKTLHGQWFLDLDVFHKGFARAKDEQGYFHINKKGEALYKQRYTQVEPFYNGVARVEREGALMTLNTHGEVMTPYRSKPKLSSGSVSADLVGFWRTETLATATELQVWDALPGSTASIAIKFPMPLQSLKRLLRALWELDYVSYQEDDWHLTEKGAFFVPQSHRFLAAAAVMWSQVNAKPWKELPQTLRQGLPKDHTFFKATASDAQLALYHQAIDGYAREDFSENLLPKDWASHRKIIGVGRSAKVWLEKILQLYPHQEALLLGEPYVLKHLAIEEGILSRFRAQSHDVQSPWPEQVDAILLPKILHYWPEAAALTILKQARQALLGPESKIYILEMLLAEEHPQGSLLDLNMLAERGGQLRFIADWQTLSAQAALKLVENKQLKPWLNLLILEPA